MKNKEIKIVMSARYNDETDEASLSSYDTVVYINDSPVGCIQNIKLEANAQNETAFVEITFPKTDILCPSNQRDIQQYKRLLENIPNVKINTIYIFDNQNKMVALDEVGTDGHIDVYRRDFKIGDRVDITDAGWANFCRIKCRVSPKPPPQLIQAFSRFDDMVLLTAPLWWFNEDELELVK